MLDITIDKLDRSVENLDNSVVISADEFFHFATFNN